MTLFDSRNVLDRLEATWKGIFNTNWKSNISPFLILLAVNITGGILSAIATPLMLVLASLTVSSAFGKGILIALVLFLLVCAIVSFYWITANLAEISTYLIFEKQAHHIPFRGMDILREAKTYLSSALRFDGYYYSILAVIILVIFLLLYPFIRDDIGLLFQIDATNYTSNTYLEHFLQMLGIGLFVG